MLPIFGGISPLFMLRLNAKVDLTVDERMISKLQENPLVQPLMMDAYTLISSTSNVSSEEDDELVKHLDGLAIPPAIAHLIKVLIEHMGDQVCLSVTHPQIGMQARIIGEGLNLIVKTVAKYLPNNNS